MSSMQPPIVGSPAQPSLIEFPCLFPIKVMGLNQSGLIEGVLNIVRQVDPHFDTQTIEQRHSKGGNYLGITVSVQVTDQIQLDGLYRQLTKHPLVKVVL